MRDRNTTVNITLAIWRGDEYLYGDVDKTRFELRFETFDCRPSLVDYEGAL
jgi:hypothetical protein